jgi:arginine deiminase
MFIAKNEETVPVAKTRACMHPDTYFRMGDVRQRNCTKHSKHEFWT